MSSFAPHIVSLPIAEEARQLLYSTMPHVHQAIALEPSMPREFYNLPKDAPALISSHFGKHPKRELADPPPAPIARSDGPDDIVRKANYFRKQFPIFSRKIRALTTWEQLYHFFDAYDLQLEGPAFLFYVINHLANENFAMDRDEAWLNSRELAIEKKNEMNKWAGQWVAANTERLASVPNSTEDLTTIFTPEDTNDIDGMKSDELMVLKEALQFHFLAFKKKVDAEAAERQSVFEAQRMLKPSSQSIAPSMHQPYSQQYHRQHSMVGPTPPIVTQASPMMAQGPILMSKGAVTGPPMMSEPQMMGPGFPVNDMRNPALPGYPMHAVPHQTLNFKETQRYVSGPSSGPNNFRNETNQPWGTRPRGFSNEGRSLRGRNAPYNNYGQHDRFGGQHDRNPKASPPRYGMNNSGDPVYVLNKQQPAQRLTPPREESQPDNQYRSFSDSSRNGFSDDHKLRSAPFYNDPNATVSGTTSTYWYVKDPPNGKSTSQYQDATLYVSGVDLEFFMSHGLKELFTSYGQVVYVSYLYSPDHGQAFVGFANENSRPAAIQHLNGMDLVRGRILKVGYPNRNSGRARSGSQSSQGYYGYSSQSNGYNRSNNRNSRQWNRFDRDTFGGAASPPLTEGFKSQIPQLPLHGSTGSMANGVRRSIDEVMHQGDFTVNRIGENNQKENTPLNPLNKVFTPRKESVNVSAAAENGEKGQKTSKNKKNGSKRNTSTRPTPVSTPIKSRSQVNLSEALKEVQHVDQVSPINSKDTEKQLMTKDHTQPIPVVEFSKSQTKLVSTPKPVRAPTPVSPEEIEAVQEKIDYIIANSPQASPNSSPKSDRSRKQIYAVPVAGNHIENDSITTMSRLEAEIPTAKPAKDPVSGQMDKPKEREVDTALQAIVEAAVGTADFSTARDATVELAVQPVNDTKTSTTVENASNEVGTSTTLDNASKEVETSEPKKKKGGKKNNKHKRNPTPKIETEKSTETNGAALSNGSPTNSSMNMSINTSFGSLKSDRKAGVTSAEHDPTKDNKSFSSSGTIDEVSRKGPKPSKASSVDSLSASIPKQRAVSGKSQKGQHSKKGSNTSADSQSSVRKADSKKFEKNIDNQINQSTVESEKTKSPTSPGLVDDHVQWPALGEQNASDPANSKPRSVPTGRITPVVPLNFMGRQQRPSSLDSKVWPQVKDCLSQLPEE